jgi:excinuclease UvrABC helicase subunit UvrB
MFDLFGRNRKSLKEMMDELDEMLGYANQELSSMSREESEVKEGSNENGEWKTETYTSPNGMFKYVITTTSYGTPKTKSPKESNELTSLRKELETAIETQEFEKACELRDRIQKIETNRDKIAELQSQLDKSIKEQNFEESIKLRDKINKMKS